MHGQFDLAPTEWATLRRLLDDALDRPAAERANWVEQLDAQFDALKPRLCALLEHAARATGELALDTLPKVETAQFLADRRAVAEDTLQVGATVGPYRLLRPLGAGGMGEVWLAERTDMLQRRQVALKLPHLLTGRAQLAERLAREREILATLEHPNIARLYDAGLTADGQPYLALEYVEGERIDTYCTRKALDVPARLHLFLQVARAVAHAHANLVVHRDLKPANILVTEAGEVRLLDFGIAKLLDEGRAQETALTQLAGRALTPDYAAPEQILGQPIGTAADVYALGVVLFELLTGSRPYQLKRDSRAALEEAIVQADVPRPSSLVTDAKLKQRLRGDLDTIVLKALKKAPAERYGTVAALADDVERHLDQRPVRAQPDSRIYRLTKFVARNRLAVGASAMVLLAIVAGAGVALWQMQMARSEQQRAESVKEFIASIFREADPAAGPSTRSVSALDLLNRARARIDSELGNQPASRAELLRVLGLSYYGLFDHRSAEDVLTQALAAARDVWGPDDLRTVDVINSLGETKKLLGKRVEAKALLAQSLAALERRGDRRSSSYLHARRLEAAIAWDEGNYDQQVAATQEAIAVGTALYGENNVIVANSYGFLARAYAVQRKRELYLETVEKSFRLQLAATGNNYQHPEVIVAQQGYGAALMDSGRLDEAKEHLTRSTESAAQVFGEQSLMANQYKSRLGLLLALRGDIGLAVQSMRQATEVLNNVDESRSVAAALRLRAYGRVLVWAGRPNEALAEFEQARRILSERSDARSMAALDGDTALALLDLGRVVEADSLLIQAMKTGAALTPPEELPRALGRLLVAQGKPLEAVGPLERAVTVARREPRRFFTAETLSDLALAQIEAGLPTAAVQQLNEASVNT